MVLSISFFFYSVYISQFEEYTLSLIDHLVQVKTSHWDRWVGWIVDIKYIKDFKMVPAVFLFGIQHQKKEVGE